jgi:hypothetical protein
LFLPKLSWARFSLHVPFFSGANGAGNGVKVSKSLILNFFAVRRNHVLRRAVEE